MIRSRFAWVLALAAATCLWPQPCNAKDLKTPPAQPLLHSLLRQGWLAYHRGDLMTALILYRQASNAFPNDPSLRYDLGCLYAMTGGFSMARQALHQALALNPHFAMAYDALGQVYEQEGAFDQALTCYATATELKPQESKFLQHLGRIQARMPEEDPR